jgi:hypothetical protein
MLIMRLNKFLCSIAFAILTVFFTCESASAQKLKWKRSKPETLYARNKKKDVLPIYIGIGTKTPSAQFHTIGTLRFEGLTINNGLNSVLAIDNSGNVFWKDMSNSNSNAWFLNGNTIGPSNFLGTTNDQDVRIRTNNTQRAVFTSSGLLGIGVTAPTAQLHSNGSVRFEGLANNDVLSRLLVMDNLGNLSWRNASSLNSNDWTLTGNNADANSFLGTINTENLRIKVNSAEKAVFTTGGSLGLGVTAPSAQLHTNGTIRFEGVSNNNTLQRLALFDNSGNLFYRDLASLQANFWSTTGNAGTSPATNYLGTTDNNRLVIRTNNVERMTVLADGKVGIGTVTPQTPLHVSGNTGIITGFPYEVAVFEKAGDTKLAVLSSDASGIGGSSITLGHSNFSSGGLFPGYEMQYGSNNQRFLRFNYLPRNASGVVQGEAANILILTDNSRVGVNLGPTGGGTIPVFPTANFHTNGTVRFQGLQNGTGNALVVDANGNVFRSATLTGKSTDELQDEIIDLKREMEELKTIVNSIKGGSLTINENNKALLYQNMPNPFSNTTTIRYYLPEGVSKAFIQVADLQGTILKTFEIVDAGKQTVIVNGGELPAGTYLYSLFADNKLIDSKKMILTR